MSAFDFAAAIAARPSGAQTAHLIAAYGDPLVGSRPHPTQRGWFEPGEAWKRANIVSVPTAELPGFPSYPGQKTTRIQLHRLVAPVFVATWAELVRRGLNDKLRTYDGSLACRHMGHDPRRPLSVHAFGAAIDFDARWNGYGVPLERAEINREVVRCFEECGWEWGGRWTGAYADSMHFQWTDPLPDVRQAEWRDAMRAPPAPRIEDIPAAPQTVTVGGITQTLPPRALPPGWEPVKSAVTRLPIPGRYVSIQRNARTGEYAVFEVESWKLKEKGLV